MSESGPISPGKGNHPVQKSPLPFDPIEVHGRAMDLFYARRGGTKETVDALLNLPPPLATGRGVSDMKIRSRLELALRGFFGVW